MWYKKACGVRRSDILFNLKPLPFIEVYILLHIFVISIIPIKLLDLDQ